MAILIFRNRVLLLFRFLWDSIFPKSAATKLPFTPNKVIQYCLALFLEQNPPVEEALLEKVKKHLEEHLIARAKEDYVNELKRVLNGGPIIYLDAAVTPPEPKLLEEEIETMVHFQLYKMNRLDISYRSMKYSYEPIPWEAFGAEISPIEFTSISDNTLED